METTLVKADDKGRVCIRGTRKGAKYLVTAENGGWWIMPAPKVKTPAHAWENSWPTHGTSWVPHPKLIMTKFDRGDVVIVDLGMAAKVRPCVVVSVRRPDAERTMSVVVPMTTEIRGGDIEVSFPRPALAPTSLRS